MARPKGSKNKTRTVKAAVDYAAVVAEKTAEKEKIESEVASLTANLDDLPPPRNLPKPKIKKLPPKQRQQKKQRKAKQKMC